MPQVALPVLQKSRSNVILPSYAQQQQQQQPQLMLPPVHPAGGGDPMQQQLQVVSESGFFNMGDFNQLPPVPAAGNRPHPISTQHFASTFHLPPGAGGGGGWGSMV